MANSEKLLIIDVDGTLTDGGIYYDENGNSVSYKAMTIDGKIYYFGGDGMVANDLYYLDGNAYLADASGARVLTKGWYWQKGYWYYVNEDGSLYIGLLNDGGHTYKMNPVMVVNQPFFTDDDRDDAYAVDENGYVIQCADGFYGMPDGGPTCYVHDGKILKSTWQYIDGNWYYFNNYSEAASGWKMINGMKYYFDTEDHYMYTGYHAINGELYYFNADGSCWGKCGPQSGWYQAEGKWYFMKGGYVTTGSAYINGITYQFDDDGVMQE